MTLKHRSIIISCSFILRSGATRTRTGWFKWWKCKMMYPYWTAGSFPQFSSCASVRLTPVHCLIQGRQNILFWLLVVMCHPRTFRSPHMDTLLNWVAFNVLSAPKLSFTSLIRWALCVCCPHVLLHVLQ